MLSTEIPWNSAEFRLSTGNLAESADLSLWCVGWHVGAAWCMVHDAWCMAQMWTQAWGAVGAGAMKKGIGCGGQGRKEIYQGHFRL